MKADIVIRVTIGCLLLLAGGCIFPKQQVSGGYGRRNLSGVPHPPESFTPVGVYGVVGPRLIVSKVAVAELGEPVVDEAILQVIASPKKYKIKRDVVTISSDAFRSPPNEIDRLQAKMIADLLHSVDQATSATQPTTVPFERKLTKADWDRIQRESEAAYAAAIEKQSADEIQRLRREAVAQHADGLVVLTMHEWVDVSQPTVFSFLNLLIVPIFILPTEYYHGQVAARAWLIDPATGRVLRSESTTDRDTRLTPWWWEDENRNQLMEQQRLAALFRVADDLVNKP